MYLREDIRTSLLSLTLTTEKNQDELLKSETLDARTELAERAMDSNDIEKERGITILAKIQPPLPTTELPYQHHGLQSSTRGLRWRLSVS